MLEEVGRGGMGVVYKARHRDLGRIIALKMILNGRFAASEDWACFRRAAGFASRVQHPRTIQLYEVGIDEGRPYLALEWAEGGMLGGRVDGVPWSPQEAARRVYDLTWAVQEYYRRGRQHPRRPDPVAHRRHAADPGRPLHRSGPPAGWTATRP